MTSYKCLERYYSYDLFYCSSVLTSNAVLNPAVPTRGEANVIKVIGLGIFLLEPAILKAIKDARAAPRL